MRLATVSLSIQNMAFKKRICQPVRICSVFKVQDKLYKFKILSHSFLYLILQWDTKFSAIIYPFIYSNRPKYIVKFLQNLSCISTGSYLSNKKYERKKEKRKKIIYANIYNIFFNRVSFFKQTT